MEQRCWVGQKSRNQAQGKQGSGWVCKRGGAASGEQRKEDALLGTVGVVLGLPKAPESISGRTLETARFLQVCSRGWGA